MDTAEEKRIKDGCKGKFTELQIEYQKWQTKQKQLAAEEAKSGGKGEETKKEAAVFQPWAQFMEATGVTDPNAEVDASQGKVLTYLGGDLLQELAAKQKARPQYIAVPECQTDLGITDNEKNGVYRIVVMRKYAEDVIKALRRQGVVGKIFDYDIKEWQKEKNELEIVKEKYDNKFNQVNQIATDAFQEAFSSLMHLKVVRAYIDGVLRFGIEAKKFTMAVVTPRKGTEKSILLQMTDHLAEANLKEMYGEKMDASEADDYWPFVCIQLSSPAHLFISRD